LGKEGEGKGRKTNQEKKRKADADFWFIGRARRRTRRAPRRGRKNQIVVFFKTERGRPWKRKWPWPKVRKEKGYQY